MTDGEVENDQQDHPLPGANVWELNLAGGVSVPPTSQGPAHRHTDDE
jgi:hypothetical protein